MRREGNGEARGHDRDRGKGFAEGWEDEPTELEQPIPMSALVSGNTMLPRPPGQPTRR